MTPEQQLLKETGDLLREVVEILIGNNLEVVKKYSLIEERIKKQLGQPSDKPSLFDVKGNPTTESVTPLPEKPVVVQPAEKTYPVPPEKVITDPLAKISSSFPSGDPRSTTPGQKKELTDPANHKGDLPWETGIPQQGKKTSPVIPQTPTRPQPEKPGESIFDNLP